MTGGAGRDPADPPVPGRWFSLRGVAGQLGQRTVPTKNSGIWQAKLPVSRRGPGPDPRSPGDLEGVHAGAMVMAGDEGQSIYSSLWPFTRSGRHRRRRRDERPGLPLPIPGRPGALTLHLRERRRAQGPTAGKAPGVHRGTRLRTREPLHPGSAHLRDRRPADAPVEGGAGAGGHHRRGVQLQFGDQDLHLDPAL
jgi:hypothetical protein